jgi:hypothetical protein
MFSSFIELYDHSRMHLEDVLLPWLLHIYIYIYIYIYIVGMVAPYYVIYLMECN